MTTTEQLIQYEPPKGILFDEITSPWVTGKLLTALSNQKPSEKEMWYCCYEMKRQGIGFEKAKDYFIKWCKWEEPSFNINVTDTYLSRVYHINTRKGAPSSCHTPARLSIPLNQVLQWFLSQVKPLVFDSPIPPPENKKAVALFFYRHGLNVLPKSIKECNCKTCRTLPPNKRGKHPDLKIYRGHIIDNPLSLSRLKELDFSNGVCILSSNSICSLDIDAPGMEYVNMSLLNGHYYEGTPSGGIHVVTRGNLRSQDFKNEENEKCFEIKGHGKLIVSYPTDGYVVQKKEYNEAEVI